MTNGVVQPMSYCRMDNDSDLYCYRSSGSNWVFHISSSRVKDNIDLKELKEHSDRLYKNLIEYNKNDIGIDLVEESLKHRKRFYDENYHVLSGTILNENSLIHAILRMVHLKKEGIRFPNIAISRIIDEFKEKIVC